MGKPINIFLAISNNILREGLILIISESSLNIHIVTPEEASETQAPDLIIFDIQQSVQKLNSLYPQAKPVLLDTGIDRKTINFILMSHRVRGIISPDESVEMFYKAIRVVNNGDFWLDQRHLKALLNGQEKRSQGKEIRGLNGQDNKIISLICEGKKNKEIGDSLYLSEHTIKSHISRIYKTLNVKNRAQLVNLAQSNLLCDLNDP